MSQTPAPTVSASSTRLSKPPSRRPTNSARRSGLFGRDEAIGDRREGARIRHHRRRRRRRMRGRQRHVRLERTLLQGRVVAHVDRALRLGRHDRIGAREGFRHARDRGRLVVPFDEVAHGLALHEGGVRPIDMRAPLALVHRAGRAHDEDRHPVDIGVIDAHRRVQEPDQVVQDHRHRPALGLGVAVRDLHGDLLVLAEQHGRLVAAVIDQRIVQAAEARARIQRDVFEPVLLDQIDDDVRLPAAQARVGCACRHGFDLVQRTCPPWAS